MKMNILCQLLAMSVLAGNFVACEKPAPKPEPEPTPETPKIVLSSPSEGETLILDKEATYSFSWIKAEGINNYKIAFSLSEKMDNPYTIAALKNPLSFSGKELDDAMKALGFEGTATVWWSIIPFNAKTEAETEVRSLAVTRLEGSGSQIGVNAETIVHKIAIYYEDMYVGTTGKRLHELTGWANPHSQAKDLARYMTEASHGVVQYEIVTEIEGETPYAYFYEDREYINNGNQNPYPEKMTQGTAVTADMCYNIFFKSRNYPGISEGVRYDYSKMITENGFDTMMNNGEIDEVWVYNHPGAGMYETCMAGPNAFWINGAVFDVPSLKRKCTVLFCNYERSVDLAMHSLAHKFENVMLKVYGKTWENSYQANKEKDLTNVERFFANKTKYGKYKEGCGHIGNCHYPCNTTDIDSDNYGYDKSHTVESYCDAWDNYPYLNLDTATPRKISSSEWGSNQMGYMKWFYGHVPHFAGINEEDLHLNNWWHYFVDWDKAMTLERKLAGEL